MTPRSTEQTLYAIGDLIAGRYRVFDKKQGGMGIVFLCEDQVWRVNGHPARVAVKTLIPSLYRVPDVVDRFYKEARLWVELGRHPNIVQAYYVKKIDGLPFIFLEFVSPVPGMGADLEGWLENGALDPEVAIPLTVQICRGLEYAREVFERRDLLFVHRDLKPGNIMMNHRRQPKITDFGIAKIASERPRTGSSAIHWDGLSHGGTMAGHVLGTPSYMSPEQCNGDPKLDHRADVYSLGCILYFMLTGSRPFVSEDYRELLTMHQHEAPEPPSVRSPNVHPAYDAIVLRCLNKSPADRYIRFHDIAQDLHRAYLSVMGRNLSNAFPVPHEEAQPSSTLGDKLNRSLSLYALGDRAGGARLFAGAIGASPGGQTAAEQTARDPAKRRLVKGGLIKQRPPSASAPTGRDAGRARSGEDTIATRNDKTVAVSAKDRSAATQVLNSQGSPGPTPGSMKTSVHSAPSEATRPVRRAPKESSNPTPTPRTDRAKPKP